MPFPAPTAHQRFAQRQRARAARRGRARRWLAILGLPFGLASCVTLAPSVPVQPNAFAPREMIAATAASAPLGTADGLGLALGEPSGPSFLAGMNQRDRMRATLCLASAIYYEAATEPDEGQRAVAQVVLNRVRHREWPNSVCGVVYQGSSAPGCQFSFACDGAMARGPSLTAWIRARRVAEAALAGSVYTPVGAATFYHTLAVSPPWAPRLVPMSVVGAHIFYRLPGDTGGSEALPFRYAGGEPTPGPLPRVAAPADLLRVAVVPSLVVAIPSPSTPVAVAARVTQSPVAPSRDDRYVAGALPDSQIRPEFRDSGKWIAN